MRDSIGGEKADSRHFHREAIRLALDDHRRVLPVLSQDAVGEAGGNAVAGEEHERRARAFVRRPCFPCREGGRLPDPADLGEARRPLVEHLHRVVAEGVDDPLREPRADAPHDTRSEEPLHAGARARGDHGDALGLDLRPEARVVHAPPDDANLHVGGHPRHHPDDGLHPAAGDFDAEDAVASLFLLVGDALDGAVERLRLAHVETRITSSTVVMPAITLPKPTRRSVAIWRFFKISR